MKAGWKACHNLTYQVIVNIGFNLLSVISNALNWVGFMLAILPKCDYSHHLSYRDTSRHT